MTDPARREAYDASIGLRGPVAGLADPTLAPPPRPMTPPRPKPQPAAAPTAAPAAGERVDAWVCPKCQTVSAVGTQFCKKCGNTLGKACPKCGKLIEATAAFCAECGVNVQAFLEEQKRQAEYKRRREQEEARRKAEEERQLAEGLARVRAWEREKKQRRNRAIGIVLAVIAAVIFACIVIIGIADAAEEQRYSMQATATTMQRYAEATATADQASLNATSTVEAFVARGGQVDEQGVLMALVPAGGFTMGDNELMGMGSPTYPEHWVRLGAFWMRRHTGGNIAGFRCVRSAP